MRLWTIAVFTAAAVVGLGVVHPFGDPRVEPAKGLDSLLLDANMPANARAVLVTKCADCHSNETRWPIYARMAPGSWLIERDNAKLSSSDVQALATLSQNAGGSDADAGGQGDPVRGKAVFERRCTGCHALDADREGPRLAGVFGRKAGSVAGFAYSAGLKKLGITWDEATLDKWLSDPDIMVPDNAMSFSVAKAAERRDVIAFLKHKRSLT